MKITPKFLAVFALPVLLLAIAGYVYVRAENRDLAARNAKLTAQNDAMDGELYRLRQEVAGRDARIGFLVSPDLKRFKASSVTDSSSCWLFWRKSDNAWYAEVTHAKPLGRDMQFRLYNDTGGTPSFIGSFEPIAETVGLQKIGAGSPFGKMIITAALRHEPEDFEREYKHYSVEGVY